LNCNLNHRTQDLVALAKEHDKPALDQLCRIYGERIRRIVRMRMGAELRTKLESVDIVQDALACAVRDLSDFTYKNEGDFLHWLSKIAENRIRDNLDKLHAVKRDMRKEVSLDRSVVGAENRSMASPGPIVMTTPSVIFARQEEYNRLEQAMDSLKPEHREVIMLAKIEGLPYSQIGERLDKSPNAVGVLLSRAMLALANAFERT
jgi:RNA polymerase sigma-70 factor (ECF subfamily)